MPGQKLDHVEFFNARACSSPNFGFQACSSLLSTRIFIFEHARARSMLDYFILDATLLRTLSQRNEVLTKCHFRGFVTIQVLLPTRAFYGIIKVLLEEDDLLWKKKKVCLLLESCFPLPPDNEWTTRENTPTMYVQALSSLWRIMMRMKNKQNAKSRTKLLQRPLPSL